MKLSACLALFALAASADAFAPITNGAPKATSTALFGGVGIWYSSSTGNTETVADYIASAAGGLDYNDIGDATTEEIEGADALIVGAPTWHTGADEQRSGTSWDEWLYDTLPSLNMDGKKVAVFGVGDQQSYTDNFCDAAGELYDLLSAKGCKIYGLTSTEGYDHQASKAIVEGDKFCGLMCDEDNQYDLSEGRAQSWIAQLKDEGFF
ncbi:Flavodoxin 2 [Seminavis robusta]|uniref:Flavodoxin 2 n=1 Tax=Seminavis robusta TaxID=568900 RepID=A0A9N8H5Z7_9STRA|nr:Flavodoxin 2 [Seminavis robusta]|eukprot:Sro156_g070910.1 Flavodoxin 2 (208) ;mRNA; f:76229-76852